MSSRDADYGTDSQAGAERQRARKHVFVVNGSPEFLDLARDLLQDERYNVTTTNYVPRTYDQIAALAPDLIVIDLVAHQESGWELLREVQASEDTGGIPVVATSTDPGALERVREERPAAATRYVAKPLDLDDLVDAIRSLIGPA